MSAAEGRSWLGRRWEEASWAVMMLLAGIGLLTAVDLATVFAAAWALTPEFFPIAAMCLLLYVLVRRTSSTILQRVRSPLALAYLAPLGEASMLLWILAGFTVEIAVAAAILLAALILLRRLVRRAVRVIRRSL